MSVMFQYLMKLHYSQTMQAWKVGLMKFQYLMKLHYSQTDSYNKPFTWAVSVPYEITLLSNLGSDFLYQCLVSVPYEITLLSNSFDYTGDDFIVSVPYEITLLSNFFYTPKKI